MTEEKKVSVVMPTYGKAAYIERAIESVYSQTYRNIELIVIDDNGQGSQRQLQTEELLQKWKERDNFRYLIQEENRGGGAARNWGIREASGYYIAFLDDDDVYLENYIESMVKELEREDFDAVYEAEWYSLYDDKCFCAKKRPAYAAGDIYLKLIGGEIPITIFLLFKKEMALEQGAFHEGLMSYDEYDVWIRWTEKLRFGCLTEPCAVVRRTSDNLSLTTNLELRKEGLSYIEKTYLDGLTGEKAERAVRFKQILESGIEKEEAYRLRRQSGKMPWRKMREIGQKYGLSLRQRMIFMWNLLMDDPHAVSDIKLSLFRWRYETLPVEKFVPGMNRSAKDMTELQK